LQADANNELETFAPLIQSGCANELQVRSQSYGHEFNAGAVTIYNATSSLVRFENKTKL
jgi:hypothetical protein